jgi:hypothetical protein
MKVVLYEGRTMLVREDVSYLEDGRLINGADAEPWHDIEPVGLRQVCSFQLDSKKSLTEKVK